MEFKAHLSVWKFIEVFKSTCPVKIQINSLVLNYSGTTTTMVIANYLS